MTEPELEERYEAIKAAAKKVQEENELNFKENDNE